MSATAIYLCLLYRGEVKPGALSWLVPWVMTKKWFLDCVSGKQYFYFVIKTKIDQNWWVWFLVVGLSWDVLEKSSKTKIFSTTVPMDTWHIGYCYEIGSCVSFPLLIHDQFHCCTDFLPALASAWDPVCYGGKHLKEISMTSEWRVFSVHTEVVVSMFLLCTSKKPLHFLCISYDFVGFVYSCALCYTCHRFRNCAIIVPKY